MFTIKKIYTWIKNYWYIPFFVLVAILLLCAGKSDTAQKLLAYSRESNKREQEEIEKIEAEKKKNKEELERKYKEMLEKLEKEHDFQRETLDKNTEKELKELVKRYEKEPEKMAQEFAIKFGLVYVNGDKDV